MTSSAPDSLVLMCDSVLFGKMLVSVVLFLFLLGVKAPLTVVDIVIDYVLFCFVGCWNYL